MLELNKTERDSHTAKDRESSDTLGDLFSNLLDTEKCFGDLSRDSRMEHFPHIETNMSD